MKVSPRIVVLVLIVSLLVAPALWAAPRSAERVEPAVAGWWSGWVESVVGWLGGVVPVIAGDEALPPPSTTQNDNGPTIDPNG